MTRVVRLATTGKLEAVDGTLLRPEGDSVVYLISDLILPSLFAADYKVLEVLDHVVGTLRCWVEATGSRSLEIKRRAIDVDLTVLRRRLGPRGDARAPCP